MVYVHWRRKKPWTKEEVQEALMQRKKARKSDNGWQPIETAPRDGTRVVLYHPNWLSCPIAVWECIEGGAEDGTGAAFAWITNDDFLTSQGDGILWPDEDGIPTHWTPPPPAAEGEK